MKINYLPLLILLVFGLILGGCQQEAKEQISKPESKPAENQQDGAFTAVDKVVTIEGKVFSYEDLQFYELMNKVEIELNRQHDQLNLQGDELNDKLAYWDEQIQYHDNFNVNLSKMIEQYTMYLLAKEKGLNVENATVMRTIEDFNAKVQQFEPADKLISEFPTDAYQNRINHYFTEKLLTEQIYETLKADAVKEKPNATEKEIAYETAKLYEGLYQSQISSIDLKINAADKK